MTTKKAKEYAAQASKSFIDRYQRENQTRSGRTVSNVAYDELRRELEKRVALIARGSSNFAA